MTQEQIDQILASVSATVLQTIKEMSDKQKEKKAIGLDTISLKLRISQQDLAPIIDHLQQKGEIMVLLNTKENIHGIRKPDSVMIA